MRRHEKNEKRFACPAAGEALFLQAEGRPELDKGPAQERHLRYYYGGEHDAPFCQEGGLEPVTHGNGPYRGRHGEGQVDAYRRYIQQRRGVCPKGGRDGHGDGQAHRGCRPVAGEVAHGKREGHYDKHQTRCPAYPRPAYEGTYRHVGARSGQQLAQRERTAEHIQQAPVHTALHRLPVYYAAARFARYKEQDYGTGGERIYPRTG